MSYLISNGGRAARAEQAVIRSDRSLATWLVRFGSVLVLATGLASCAVLKGREKPRETYDISAPTQFSGLGSTGAQVLVKTPTAIKSIDSDRIIVRPSPAVITYLAGAQWADTVPLMVQAKLVQAFENSGATGATARPGDGLVIDYQLVSEIRRFEVLDGQVVIDISIKLLADKTGQVIETRIFEASTRAGGSDADAVVAAFDRAFAQLSREIVAWVVRRV